jgi:glycolate oxidase iron-sulfur subunit
MGREAAALAAARANIDAWWPDIEAGGLDAIVVTASGCGTMVKDYGHLLRGDPAYAGKGARVAELARDITELVAEIGLGPVTRPGGLAVAYHSACSLQHGQRVRGEPRALLADAGFRVLEVPDGHLCCGSAGTYNLLQPELADQLRLRKVATIESVQPDAVAAGNIGCLTQIAGGTAVPVLHTIELLDWATGGPRPAALPDRAAP